jgi:hypothetical protein
MLFIFQGAFTIGFQATVWVYPSEILPLKARQKGSSISTAANWICNFIIVYITPPAIHNIGWRTYIIFAVLNTTWVPIVVSFLPYQERLSMNYVADSVSQYLFFPETKGMYRYKSLVCDQCMRILTPLTGLALEDVDKLFATDSTLEMMLDEKIPDAETVEVRSEA